jgi:hypothetical protein
MYWILESRLSMIIDRGAFVDISLIAPQELEKEGKENVDKSHVVFIIKVVRDVWIRTYGLLRGCVPNGKLSPSQRPHHSGPGTNAGFLSILGELPLPG